MTRKKFLCFIHIERSGGTTLGNLLAREFPRYLSLRPWYCWANEPENVFKPAELRELVRYLPFLQGVGGHTTRPWLDYAAVLGREVCVFTFLRNPVDRYLSQFNYQRVRAGVPWTLEEFLDEGRFSNWQTKRLAGRFHLEAAKDALEQKIDLVGIVERFDESLLLLRQAIGEHARPFYYQRRNELAGPDSVEFDALPAALKDRVQEANDLDLALYDYARKTIFPRQQQAYHGDLARDLEAFQLQNRVGRDLSIAALLARPYRRLAKTLIEPVVHARHARSRPVRW